MEELQSRVAAVMVQVVAVVAGSPYRRRKAAAEAEAVAGADADVVDDTVAPEAGEADNDETAFVK